MHPRKEYMTDRRRNTCGLPDYDEHGSAVTEYAYARRLASYLRDPSTIRARTMDLFGKSPSLEEIRRLIPVRSVPVEKPKPVPVVKEAAPEPEPKVVQIPVIMSTPMKTPTEVIVACAKPFKLTYQDLEGPSRNAYVVKPRWLAFAVLKARGSSYSQIGKRVGGRDHSTIIHGIQRFFAKTINDPVYLAAWMKLAPCKFKMVRTLEEFEMMM